MKPNFNSELVTKASLSRLRYLIHKKCYGCKLDRSCKDFKLSLHSDTRRQRSSGCFRLSVQHCFHGLYCCTVMDVNSTGKRKWTWKEMMLEKQVRKKHSTNSKKALRSTNWARRAHVTTISDTLSSPSVNEIMRHLLSGLIGKWFYSNKCSVDLNHPSGL